MDVLHHLSAEVRRIVTAPYAASPQVWLKRQIPTPVDNFVWDDSLRRSVQKLLRILDGTPEYEIQRWASGRCDINLLCIAVLKNLQSGHWAIEAYGTVGIALLSTPLYISIPAKLPTFLESVLARAVAAPSADTIRPVYLILSGVGCTELRSLSQPLVIRLQEELKKILCCNVKVDDHHAKMLCLALSISGTDKRTWIVTRGSMSKAPLNGLLKSEVDPKARLAAVELTLALYDHSPFPTELRRVVQKLFQEPAHVYTSRELTRAYVECMDEPSLAITMLHMIQLTKPEGIPSVQALLDVNMATAQAIELAKLSAASQDLRRKILYLLSTSEFLSPLRSFTAYVKLPCFSYGGNEDHMHGVCSARYAAAQQELQQKISFLILQTALHASIEEKPLEPWLATALLEKQTMLAPHHMACKLAQAGNNARRPSLFETGSTPEESPAAGAWQDRLKNNLLRDAEYQQESVIKIVNEVCRDLEARCDDAERPYREELARSQMIQLKLKALEDQVADQQNQNVYHVQTINELETQKFQFEGRANTAEKHVQDISTEADGLRKAIADTKSEASQTQSAMAEAARQQDLFYMATMTSKDRELEGRDIKINELEARAVDLGDKLALSVALEKKAVEKNERFELELAQQYEKLDRAMALSAEKQRQIEGLLESKSSLAADNVSLLLKVEESVQRCGSLESSLDAQAAAFQAEKSGLQAAHEEFKAAKEAEVQADFKRETDDMSRQNQDRITNLKKKCLQCDLKEKTKELAREQEMKKLILKLAGKEGQDSPPPVPSCLDPDRPARSSIASRISSKSSESPGSSQSGSTPKRPKFTSPWNSKTPSLASRRLSSNPSKTVIREFAGKPVRRGLSELGSASANRGPSTQPECEKKGRRHTSIAVPAPSRKLDDDGETCFENQSFTDSDISTSTTRERLAVYHDDTTGNI
ncbi:MAG: hypothetical protein Q9195_004811 [Heterodermia aff. obscurata]